ncbi:unnamed protein product [Symbiodinium necroappetens]|uniref:Uncharacterized protein n=1 Tax=Symbiodinium necroappetens TaxID=1628268 RepID=A0A813C701_9DINO|nr:unnamed protein product [Symbiodinium necroappetens]
MVAKQKSPKKKPATTVKPITQGGLGDFEQVDVRSAKDLARWLKAHHTQDKSVWITRWKQGTKFHVPLPEIVSEALAWGWIDSHARKLDEQRSLLLISPRRKGSVWSSLNKTYVSQLEKAGRMQPSGRAKIEQAKKDGSWNFLDDVDKMIEPADLKTSLQKRGLLEAWRRVAPSKRRGLLAQLKMSVKTETRSKRIAEMAALAQKS